MKVVGRGEDQISNNSPVYILSQLGNKGSAQTRLL